MTIHASKALHALAVALLASGAVACSGTAKAGPPDPEVLKTAMQADFIADLARTFGPRVGESDTEGRPNFEVTAFEQESVEPTDTSCWVHTGTVTTQMRIAMPVPKTDARRGRFTVCHQDGTWVVTQKQAASG